MLRHRVAIALVILVSVSAIEAASGYGRFIGRVVTEWLEEPGPDRRMRVLEPFTYEDPNGGRWPVPAGTIVDGASIPRFLWGPVGSPFTGDYRNASVVHDYYCDTRSRPWKDVHRVFYYGSVAGGVEPITAKNMYLAVYVAGPRWSSNAKSCYSSCHASTAPKAPDVWTPTFDQADVERLQKWILGQDPSLEEIEQQADAIISGPHR